MFEQLDHVIDDIVLSTTNNIDEISADRTERIVSKAWRAILDLIPSGKLEQHLDIAALLIRKTVARLSKQWASLGLVVECPKTVSITQFETNLSRALETQIEDSAHELPSIARWRRSIRSAGSGRRRRGEVNRSPETTTTKKAPEKVRVRRRAHIKRRCDDLGMPTVKDYAKRKLLMDKSALYGIVAGDRTKYSEEKKARLLIDLGVKEADW
jgi:hypothetical protein